MANEIKATASLQCTNGSVVVLPQVGASQMSLTQTTLGGGGPGFLSIGTSEEDITLTDITNCGWVWIENLDTTNFVKYGPKSAGAMIEFGRLMPSTRHLFQLAPTGVTIRAVADTAACKVHVYALEK